VNRCKKARVVARMTDYTNGIFPPALEKMFREALKATLDDAVAKCHLKPCDPNEVIPEVPYSEAICPGCYLGVPEICNHDSTCSRVPA
jgi:hypothetical protein